MSQTRERQRFTISETASTGSLVCHMTLKLQVNETNKMKKHRQT